MRDQALDNLLVGNRMLLHLVVEGVEVLERNGAHVEVKRPIEHNRMFGKHLVDRRSGQRSTKSAPRARLDGRSGE